MAKKRTMTERFYDKVLNDDVESTAKWLKSIDHRYVKYKDELSPEFAAEIEELSDAISDFQDEYGGFPKEIAEAIDSSQWAKDMEAEAKAEFFKMVDERMSRLDEAELKTNDELTDLIWAQQNRREISASYFDYDEDAYAEYNLEVPRKFSDEDDENRHRMSLKAALSDLIYNRAPFVMRVYKPRGKFDIYGVFFTSEGDWRPVPVKELKESFSHDPDTGVRITPPENDEYKEFPKAVPFGKKTTEKAKGILQFPGKKLHDKHDFDFKPQESDK